MRAVCWWLALAGLWLLLSDNHHGDELVVGAVAATLGTVVALVAWDRMVPSLRWPRGALADVPRIAWRMALESWLLLRALWQTVVLRRPVRGRWVSQPIDDADTPEARGRRIWAVLSGTMAPNRVVGDAEGGRVVVHELVRR
jgi:hypothetical protein